MEAPSQTCELIKKLHHINKEIDSYEQEISLIKQQIMTDMQEAETLTYQGKVLATWKSPKPSMRLDTKRLEQEHPEITKAYQTPIQNSRRLVIKELS